MVRDHTIKIRCNDDELDDLERVCSYYNISKSEAFRKAISDIVDRLDVGETKNKQSMLNMKKIKESFDKEYRIVLENIASIPKSRDDQRKEKHDTKRWRERDYGIKILESMFKDEMYSNGLKDYYDTYMYDLNMLDPESDISHYVRSNVVIVEDGDLVTPIRRIRNEE